MELVCFDVLVREGGGRGREGGGGGRGGEIKKGEIERWKEREEKGEIKKRGGRKSERLKKEEVVDVHVYQEST